MGLIEQGEGGESNIIYLDLNVTTGPTKEAPFLCSKSKNEATGAYEINKKYQAAEGIVKSVTQNPTKFKKDTIRGVQITLMDGDQEIMISPTLTNGSKNLINTALGNIGKKIKVSPFLNKSSYPDVYCVGEDGERAEGKYKYNEEDLFDKIWEACTPKAEENVTPVVENPFD